MILPQEDYKLVWCVVHCAEYACMGINVENPFGEGILDGKMAVKN